MSRKVWMSTIYSQYCLSFISMVYFQVVKFVNKYLRHCFYTENKDIHYYNEIH